MRSISSSPIFAPGRALYRRPRHSGSLQASFSRDRVSRDARWRVRRIARRHRLQLPDDLVERGLRHVECERRGATRAPHGRLHHDRQSGRSRLHGAARLSRPRPNDSRGCPGEILMSRPTAAISWSGGKDSCAAYHRARPDFDIVAAITMFNEDGTRSRSHGLRPEIVVRAGGAAGPPSRLRAMYLGHL